MDQRVRVHSTNPLTTLVKTAASWNMKPSELTFTIVSFSSSYTKDGEAWEDIGEKNMSVFEDDALFLNPKLEVHQDYKIEISPKLQDNNKIHIELISNKNKTELKAKLFANPKYVFKKTLALDLMQSIYKKMINEGYIIGLRIFKFKEELLKLANFIRSNGIDEDLEILIARGVEPKQPEEEHIIYQYKEKYNQHKEDVSFQGFAVDVKEGELLAQKIKPFPGSFGKDLKLAMIEVLPLRHKDPLEVRFNKAKVEEKETPTSFDYIALKTGFILKSNLIDIENTLDFNVVDFKKTGSIYFNLENDITINVKNSNPMDEAIKSRITLEANTLNIIGNLAQDVTLKADVLRLDGTTHVKCLLEAKDAVIKNLKCKFNGSYVKVDHAENAEIIADIAIVKKAVGGFIKADKIYVGELHGSCECIAKDIIVVGKCLGQNRLHIQGQEHVLLENGSWEDLLHTKKELLADEEELPKRLKVLKYNINLNRPSIQLLDKKAKLLKGAGQKIPTTYLQKIKAFSDLVKKYNDLVRKKEGLDDAKVLIDARLEEAQASIVKTMIINKSGEWSDANEISFHLFSPKKDKLFHSSVVGDDTKCFSVQVEAEDTHKFTLVKADEYDESLIIPPPPPLKKNKQKEEKSEK